MATYRPGQSGNPKGKPPGSNKTQKIRNQLMTAVPGILQALCDQAMNGDAIAARLILERTLPALRPETRAPIPTVPTDPDGIVAAVASGQLTPDQADCLMAVLLAQARIRETAEIVARLENIERAVAELRR